LKYTTNNVNWDANDLLVKYQQITNDTNWSWVERNTHEIQKTKNIVTESPLFSAITLNRKN
jgi:hypothetical protein